MKRLLGLLGILLVLLGCSYSKQKQLPEAVSPSTNFAKSELTFESVYSSVLKTNCISCHGTSGNINLESYGSTKANIEKIYQAVLVDRKMPKAPATPLTSDQLGLLKAWIDAGAPENSEGVPPMPPLEPTFDSIKAHILEPKCLMCHSRGQPIARIPLVTRDDLLNSPLELVIPGNADESGIVLVIMGVNPDKIMPPQKDSSGKPSGFSRLSEEEIRVIKEWINRGAQ